MLAELRKSIALLEHPPGFEDAGFERLGIEAIDTALGGGIVRGALHEIAALSETHVAAATGFALGVIGPRRKSIVWIAEDMARAESGMPCGIGLDEFGVAPERLITVAVTCSRDLLWAMEEALHCRAVGAVIGEFRHEAIDAVALRRLSLAASEHSALALLLRATPRHEASTALTRWTISSTSSCATHGPGPPRIVARLLRNRRGPLGSWELEWSESDERFALPSAHSQPVVLPIIHRSARAVAHVA